MSTQGLILDYQKWGMDRQPRPYLHRLLPQAVATSNPWDRLRSLPMLQSLPKLPRPKDHRADRAAQPTPADLPQSLRRVNLLRLHHLMAQDRRDQLLTAQPLGCVPPSE